MAAPLVGIITGSQSDREPTHRRARPPRPSLAETAWSLISQRTSAYRSFQTHELDVLLRLSGQEARIKQKHFAIWNIVAIWKTESRYNVIGTAQHGDAAAMIQAAEQLLAVL